VRKIKLQKGNLTLKDEVISVIEKRVTTFGSGAKVDCPKKYLGKRVYILVCKDDPEPEEIG